MGDDAQAKQGSMEGQGYKCRTFKHKLIVLKPHHKCVIYGACKLLVLGGQALINQYATNSSAIEEENFIEIIAPYRFGLPVLVENHCTRPEKKLRLMNRVRQICNENIVAIVAQLFDKYDGCITVLLIDKALHGIAPLISLIYGRLTPETPKTCSLKVTHFTDYPLYANECAQNIQGLINYIENRVLLHGRCSVLTVGEANSGKSTFLRTLANVLLSLSRAVDSVYMLDLDIGQSEMTPPTCMSLSKIEKKPFLGRQYCRAQPCFEVAYLYGDVRITCVEQYNSIVTKLVTHYNQVSSTKSVLLVNTMGFIVDEGLSVIAHILEVLKPESCAAFGITSNFFRTFPRSLIPNMVISIFTAISPSCAGFRPTSAEMRDINLLGYLYLMISKTGGPHFASFNVVPAFIFSFENVCLCFDSARERVRDAYVLESVNATIVALGYFEDDENAPPARRLFERNYLPRIRILPSFYEEHFCVIGFGIIRGIDMEKRQFHLITPLPEAKLRKVTCFARPNSLELPRFFFSYQVGDALYTKSVPVNYGDFKRDLYKPAEQRVALKRNAGRRLIPRY